MGFSKQDYIDHYDNHYKRSGLSGSGTGEYLQKIAMWYDLGYKDGMTVLDYGSGWGAMLPGITNKKGYLGVDISPEAIRLGREKFPNVQFRVFEMGQLKDKKFDWVCAQSVFTHTPKDTVAECLEDLRGVMKDKALVDVLYGQDNPSDMHVRHYEPEEWNRILEDNGFDYEHVKSISFPGGKHEYYLISDNRA